jgi:hypothetical protein
MNRAVLNVDAIRSFDARARARIRTIDRGAAFADSERMTTYTVEVMADECSHARWMVAIKDQAGRILGVPFRNGTKTQAINAQKVAALACCIRGSISCAGVE